MKTYCKVSGKQSFQTRAEADRVMREINARPGHKRSGSAPYRCLHDGCDSWHLTCHFQSRSHHRRQRKRLGYAL